MFFCGYFENCTFYKSLSSQAPNPESSTQGEIVRGRFWVPAVSRFCKHQFPEGRRSGVLQNQGGCPPTAQPKHLFTIEIDRTFAFSLLGATLRKVHSFGSAPATFGPLRVESCPAGLSAIPRLLFGWAPNL